MPGKSLRRLQKRLKNRAIQVQTSCGQRKLKKIIMARKRPLSMANLKQMTSVRVPRRTGTIKAKSILERANMPPKMRLEGPSFSA